VPDEEDLSSSDDDESGSDEGSCTQGIGWHAAQDGGTVAHDCRTREAQRALTACRALGSVQPQRKRLSFRPGAMTTREMREAMAVKRLITSAGLALLMLGLVACESEQAHYFKNRVNHMSQDAVVRRFGPPHRAHELTTGRTVWAYESRDRVDCTVYILRFDRAQVLRDWNERTC
jgi:hypothetical protein